MPERSLLQQLSTERAALATHLVPRIATVAVGRRRSVSAIRWRPPYLITAAEALAGAEEVAWRAPLGADPSDTAPQRAEVVAADLATDVAVIRTQDVASAGAPAAPLVRDALTLGETVAILGCDGRGALLRWSAVSVAGAAWTSRRGGQIAQRIEFDAALDARFEGALVADTAGRVAAMQVTGPFGRSLGIPAETIERVLSTVEQQGHLPRPYLGLRLQTLWLDAAAASRLGRRATRIPVVTGVDPDSPAARANLEPGDLIESVDGQEVDGVDAVARALTGTAPGASLVLGLRRGGASEPRTLTVVDRPRAAD
ncbi:MAG TPA: S1C family serine protease [Steroidobacteraceae bacterium]|nr:S1C family serine protease [Steroidobacteraceae bacterium]